MTDDKLDPREIDIDPPVMVDEQLVVECEHSDCGRRRLVGTEVDAVVTDADDGDWKIRFVPTDDGRLTIDGAECHEHRTDKAIDRLAQAQKRTIRKMYKRSEQTIEQIES